MPATAIGKHVTWEEIMGICTCQIAALVTTPLSGTGDAHVKAKLDTMVTVVDAGSFPALYGARTPLAARPDLGGGDGGLRPVVDLLAEQLE